VKLDRVLANVPAGRAGAEAAAAEAAGLDGVWSTEAATDSLLTSMAAIRRTSRISVGTSIAVAFQRNPMSLAYAAWDLAAASQGRFQLGLGAATAEQVQDRFGMPFSHPIERMRDTVEALRAVWHAWRTGDRLAYDGRFHRHDLMTPVFTPDHHDHPIPVLLAAVGTRMLELAGEVADGVVLHPLTSPAAMRDHVLPALDRGLERSGRTRDTLTLFQPVFVVSGADADRLRAMVRAQIAWYAARPAYRPLLAAIGHDGIAEELRELREAGRWRDRGKVVSDDLYDAVTVEADPDDLAAALKEHLPHHDRVAAYFGWPDPPAPRVLAAALA
jgi:probable F420-dependent oxidoreductase